MGDVVTDSNILELHQIVDESLDIPSAVNETEDTQPSQQKEAQIWTYFGVVGGAGVTSLAVQAAWELSSQDINGPGKTLGLKAVLVDLDFERGDCAAYLDIKPSMSIDDLNAAEGRMDAGLAASFISQVSPGLYLISAKSELGGNDLVSPGALLSLLDTISGLFDIVILDVPPMWRPWTQAVIGAADKFALVTECRIPALHQAKKLSVDIMQAMQLSCAPEVILNKFERRSLRGGLSLADAQKVLGDLQCSQICVDDETVRIAINTGKPAGALRFKSRYVKSVRSHVQNWYSANINLETNLGENSGTNSKIASHQYDRRVARR